MVVSRKGLILEVVQCPKDDKKNSRIIEKLLLAARKERDKRLEELSRKN
jgi:hypothetical protein